MKAFMICIAMLVAFTTVDAQSESEELAKIKNSVKQEVSKQMQGWTYRSVQPTQGSAGVIIQQWQLNDIIVKVAVTRYEKQKDAEDAFQEFKAHLKVEEQASKSRGKQIHWIKKDSLPQMGDDGFVWDIRGSEAVAFRKGKLIVNVSVPSPPNNKDGFFSQKFAQHVVKALE
jgi:hypothetical protein